MKETQTFDSWTEDWARYLTTDFARHELVEGLLRRWKRNSPSQPPKHLYPPAHDHDGGDWSFWLERFLLTDSRDATACATVIVSAVEEALKQWDCDLGRITWFRDILALRRVAYAKSDVRLKAAALILTTIARLDGTAAAPELASYMHLEKLFSSAVDCMVTELYEENFVRHWYSTGLSATHFAEFTLIWLLEKKRLELVDRARADHSLQSTPTPEDLEDPWLHLAREYQKLADDLFETLLTLSSQAAEEGDTQQKTSNFTTFLRQCFHTPPFGVNNLAPYLGYQRLLDIHWLRLSVIVSPARGTIATCVRNFIIVVARTQSELQRKISRCSFSIGLPGILTPKNDPTGVYLTSGSAVHEVNNRITVEVTEVIKALAEELPELEEALGGDP